jgi:CHAT domain-containing protein
MLSESGTEIREGVDVKLIERERELNRLISLKAAQQTRLLNRKHTETEAAAAEKELDTLTAELELVQGRIHTSSPRFASLTQPAPLDAKEIQKSVVDQDTVLLEYSLGAEKSFLWAVTPSAIDAFELPKRAEVEAAAKRVYDLLTARNRRPEKETAAARATRLRQSDEDYAAAAAKASQMLLGPVAAKIAGKRLLIVGEGVLSYLPFGALPEPASGAPLIVDHEIVMAPSASVVAVLRQETAGRKPAEKALAVLADPVFTPDDARIAQQRSAVKPADGGEEFVRLRFSRTEADQIARLAPASATLKALDFEASRELAMKPDLGRYRIVHFATHSVLNNDRPELSGVVLSLVDRSGKTQNGFLRLYDVYNLRLGADLVVLSACQTALGGEIKGEGLIGLTRGFLYAGAPRVVASLWEIDDRGTADLMKHFYEGMLARGERPAAALRNAQIAMWKTKGSEQPYYWAAFTLQGEWR